MNNGKKSQGGVYEQRQRTSFGGPGGSPQGDRRCSRRAARRAGSLVGQRKMAAVLRLLRGEDIETLSRELGVTATTLSGWREQSLIGMEANLKAREADVENEETQRLKSLVADLNLSNELLGEKIHRLEAKRPLVWRRSHRFMAKAIAKCGRGGAGNQMFLPRAEPLVRLPAASFCVAAEATTHKAHRSNNSEAPLDQPLTASPTVSEDGPDTGLVPRQAFEVSGVSMAAFFPAMRPCTVHRARPCMLNPPALSPPQ